MAKNQKKYDYLIVGAGLFGSVFAYLAACDGKKCLVIDKRNHIAGNIYNEQVCGINVHKYGAHIFHTSDKEVWNFVTSLEQFNNFVNSPLANYEGKLYNLPFNMNTFYHVWGVTTPQQAAAKLDEQRAAVRAQLDAAGILTPENLEQQARLLVGDDIYRLLIKEYTEKQWGRPCSTLAAFIIRRLPVRLTYDNNYFNDAFQGIPVNGYTALVSKLLKNVDVLLETDFFEDRCQLEMLADKIVYTGMIDGYFDFCYGHLQYRTVEFETEVIREPNFQGNAVVNYTSANVPYTRIIEHKHFECFGQTVYDNPLTVVSREFSSEWAPAKEPYYPVNDAANNDAYQKYKLLADNEKNVIFGGRLAEFKYYDMAPVIRAAFDAYKKEKSYE